MKYIKAMAGANNSVVYEIDDGRSYLWSGGTRAWRNNNPGNIRGGDFANRRGAIGTAGGFAIFPNYETGFTALIALLCTSTYQQLTMEQAINRYAPPIENNTGAYVTAVEKQIGVSRTTPMSQLSENNLRDFAKAIEKHEGYKEGNISLR